MESPWRGVGRHLGLFGAKGSSSCGLNTATFCRVASCMKYVPPVPSSESSGLNPRSRPRRTYPPDRGTQHDTATTDGFIGRQSLQLSLSTAAISTEVALDTRHKSHRVQQFLLTRVGASGQGYCVNRPRK